MVQQKNNMNNILKLARLGRLYKLVKLTRLIKIIKLVKERSKIVSYINEILKVGVGFERLFFFLVLFLMLSHIVSCLWILTASLSDDKIGTWLDPKLLNADNSELYLTSIYVTI